MWAWAKKWCLNFTKKKKKTATAVERGGGGGARAENREL